MNILKTLRNSLFVCVISLFVCVGCTVTTSNKKPESASFGMDGKLNSGYISTIKNTGMILDSHTRDRYNELIKTYSLGVQSYKFVPPLVKDYGLTEVTQEDGSKKYLFNPSALSYFRTMNIARKNGLAAYKE